MAEVVSCLYMRTAIHELTAEHGRTPTRYSKFLAHFPCVKENMGEKRFADIARRLLKVMQRAWHGGAQARRAFLEHFSCKRWNKLDKPSRSQHTLSSCAPCARLTSWHASFPAKSSRVDPLLAAARKAPAVLSAAAPLAVRTETALKHLNEEWKKETGVSFEDAVVQASGTTLQKKLTTNQKKQLKRTHARAFKEELETSWHEGDMDAVMKNGISFGRWDRLVLDESLAKRPCKTTAKSTRHTPVVITWDTEQVLRDAEQWPAGTEINWSAFAREHNVPGKNGGQAVKDYLREQGVDVLRLENRTAPRVRQRRKKKSFGCNIKFPMHKTSGGIKEDLAKAIEDGRFHPGEEVCSKVLCSFTLSNGEVERKEVEVHGRRVPMLDLRKRILEKHEKNGLMRHLPEDLLEYASMSREELTDRLTRIGEWTPASKDMEECDLADRLYRYEHTRLLILANDHADVLGRGYLMEVLQVVYDPAIHVTDEEYQEANGVRINVQSAVEVPIIRLFAISGSSEEEYLHCTEDRLSDLKDIQQPLARLTGDDLHDKLVGFMGDMPMRWLELGLQKGGKYRCGSGCGLPISLFPYYADSVCAQIPSIVNLQERATAFTIAANARVNEIDEHRESRALARDCTPDWGNSNKSTSKQSSADCSAAVSGRNGRRIASSHRKKGDRVEPPRPGAAACSQYDSRTQVTEGCSDEREL